MGAPRPWRTARLAWLSALLCMAAPATALGWVYESPAELDVQAVAMADGKVVAAARGAEGHGLWIADPVTAEGTWVTIPGRVERLAAHGEWVAFTVRIEGRQQLHVGPLEGPFSRPWPSTGNQLSPTVHGDRIAWLEVQAQADVVTARIGDAEPRPVTADETSHDSLHMNERFIAWVDFRAAVPLLRLPSEVAAEAPAAEEGLRVHPSNTDIYVYDLEAQRMFPAAEEMGPQEMPVLAGGRLAYASTTLDGHSSVRSRDLLRPGGAPTVLLDGPARALLATPTSFVIIGDALRVVSPQGTLLHRDNAPPETAGLATSAGVLAGHVVRPEGAVVQAWALPSPLRVEAVRDGDCMKGTVHGATAAVEGVAVRGKGWERAPLTFEETRFRACPAPEHVIVRSGLWVAVGSAQGAQEPAPAPWLVLPLLAALLRKAVRQQPL